MSLTKQIFLYSVDTSAFYDDEEQRIHRRLGKLYQARSNTSRPKNIKQALKADSGLLDWRKRAYNRLIKKEKERLSNILNSKANTPIVRNLNPKAIHSKNVISLFMSSLTRALNIGQNELTLDLMVVNVFFFQVFNNMVKNGFMYNGERYVFLTASAGQIRTKRAVFIRESAYEQIRPKLMCGLTVEDINNAGGINSNKYMAYLALNNSATDVWHKFDIDKSIVVEDFETNVPGLVDYIDSNDYSITRKEAEVPIPHMDGCGIMLKGKTRMVRMPWVKGLLVKFPYDKFIQERCGGEATVVDIYGQPHNIIAEDIRYIFTRSQFKLAKYYKSWDDYKQKFKENGCEACYCNIEEDVIPQSRINYQMLQTLTDMKDSEIERLTYKSIEEINAIGSDYQTNMRLVGALDTNKNPSYFQQALMIYPELFRDKYSQEVLKQTKKSLIKQAKAGRLRVNGGYYFISPDLYAFCEWLFLGEQNPQGLLKDGEVFCNQFGDGDELACLRSPHLYREWAIRNNVRNEELDRWFGGTKCIYTSCHDLISRFLMFDCDGDKSLVIKDKVLTKVAKRNMKGIVPLAYDLRKAKGEVLNSDTIYNGMIHAYTGGNIGPISNNISKIWNNASGVGDEEINVVKYLCLYNNAVIDYAKTLWLPTPPPDINKLIRSYTKANVPNFFIYAKDKEAHQVEPSNDSTMNRIARSIPTNRIRFSKSLSPFDYTMLQNRNAPIGLQEHDKVIERYRYWQTHQYYFTFDSETHAKQEDVYVYQCIRERLIEETGQSVDYIINTLVRYLYFTKPNSTKKSLWACFGKELVENLTVNTRGLGKICKICGKRYSPTNNRQLCCSDVCSRKNYKQNQAELRFQKHLRTT